MSMMLRRRELMLATQQSGGLPAEYQQVEYLRNSGTQYIDTGYVARVEPKIVTKFYCTNNNDTDRFGFKNNVYPSFIVDLANGSFYNRFGATNFIRIQFAASLLNRMIDATFGKNTVITFVDVTTGDTNTFTANYGNVNWTTNSQTMRIFGGRNISGGMRLLTCDFYDGDIIVGKYIPCVRKTDNKPGLYDLVSKTFFTNAGTGEFSVGPNVN